jgi:hypothetical protein
VKASLKSILIASALSAFAAAHASENKEAIPSLDAAIGAPLVEKPLSVKTGQRLSQQLKLWLEAQGNESWDAHATTHGRIRDIEFSEEFHAQGSLVQVLRAILTPFSFEADVIDMGTKKRVIVRNASNRF